MNVDYVFSTPFSTMLRTLNRRGYGEYFITNMITPPIMRLRIMPHYPYLKPPRTAYAYAALGNCVELT